MTYKPDLDRHSTYLDEGRNDVLQVITSPSSPRSFSFSLPFDSIDAITDVAQVDEWHLLFDEGRNDVLQVITSPSSPRSFSFSLPFDSIDAITDVVQVSEWLRHWHEDKLAERIEYFASDQDLEDDEVALTVDSAKDFLSFLNLVHTTAQISLTCSPEGWLCASWKFSDDRRATLWFRGSRQIAVVAIDRAGEYVDLEDGKEIGPLDEVVLKLVEAGLFKWRPSQRTVESLSTEATMWHANIVAAELVKIMLPRQMFFYSEQAMPELMRNSYQRIGSSTFPRMIDSSSSPALSTRWSIKVAQ